MSENPQYFIVPTLRRGNALGNAPALLTVTPERHYRIPTPEHGNDALSVILATLFQLCQRECLSYE
jgi:hypothetical protein